LSALLGLRFRKIFAAASVLAILIGCIYAAFKTTGLIDHTDGVSHFQIARFAFKHPENFLHHWGKPLFTLLSAPFAQIGFEGMVLFNLLLFVLICFSIFKISQAFEWKTGFLAPLMLLGAAKFFETMNAGLTEILMATMIIFTLYLVVYKKYALAAILLSFGVVARPESYLAIPLLGLFFMLDKQWKYIPLLATGFILYSIIGYFHYDDILWLLNKDPYPDVSPYGSGSATHFIERSDRIFGVHNLVFLLIGLGFLLFAKVDKFQRRILLYAALLSIGTMAIHSYLWYTGTKGSLGLTRVVSTVVPLAVLLACFGLSQLWKLKFTSQLWGKVTLGGITIFLLFAGISNGLGKSSIVREPDNIQQSAKLASDWYLGNADQQYRVAYLSPLFEFYAGIDEREPGRTIKIWSVNNQDPTISLKAGEYMVWDNGLGALEGNMPREVLVNHPRLDVQYQHMIDSYEIIIVRVKPET
jgi:hypothetical protein